jgi:UDP-N-acetyl-D-mannosaminuronate dehydrogenase
MSSVPCTPEEFSRYDAIVISTAHSQFKDPKLYAKSKLVIDTRNIVPQSGATRVIHA